MCGRFTLRAAASVLAEQFAVFEIPNLTPRFNVAPAQPVVVVRLSPEEQAPTRQPAALRWGLIPGWAKEAAIGNRMINARSETVAEKPAYRAAFRRRRCLVLSDGFFEWRRTERVKQPYFIHLRDDRPFAFAGLWESWQGPDHWYVESCTLLTTESNELVQPIHHRMPVILSEENYDRWLDRSIQTADPLRPLFAPYPSEPMEAYPVSTHVNSPTHDDPKCVQRVA